MREILILLKPRLWSFKNRIVSRTGKRRTLRIILFGTIGSALWAGIFWIFYRLMKLTRAKLEELAHEIFARLEGPVKQALADAKLKAGDIDEVILVGGSTRIPAVQNLVRRLTGGKEPNQSVNPDEWCRGRGCSGRDPGRRGKGCAVLDVTPCRSAWRPWVGS